MRQWVVYVWTLLPCTWGCTLTHTHKHHHLVLYFSYSCQLDISAHCNTRSISLSFLLLWPFTTTHPSTPRGENLLQPSLWFIYTTAAPPSPLTSWRSGRVLQQQQHQQHSQGLTYRWYNKKLCITDRHSMNQSCLFCCVSLNTSRVQLINCINLGLGGGSKVNRPLDQLTTSCPCSTPPHKYPKYRVSISHTLNV